MDPLQERLERLQELKERRENCIAENMKAILNEEISLKKDVSKTAALERKKQEAEKYLATLAAKEAGIDLERLHNTTYSLEENERWKAKQEGKESRKDPGFTNYTQMAQRKYDKQASTLDPQTVLRQNLDVAKKRLAESIKEDQKRRLKRSSRRHYDDFDDVTYINERNAHFNKKVNRAYDQYTSVLKENLEKGLEE